MDLDGTFLKITQNIFKKVSKMSFSITLGAEMITQATPWSNIVDVIHPPGSAPMILHIEFNKNLNKNLSISILLK